MTGIAIFAWDAPGRGKTRVERPVPNVATDEAGRAVEAEEAEEANHRTLQAPTTTRAGLISIVS